MIGFLARHVLGRGGTVAASTLAAESTATASTIAAGGALVALVPVLNVAIVAYTAYKICDLITSRMDACRITVCENQVATLELGKYKR